MKINILRGYTKTDKVLGESWDITPILSTLNLCGQGRSEGDSQGLIPVKLPGGLVVTPRVSVTSAISTNRRGTKSAVIKVSMPYTALSMNDDGTSVVGTDPARSSGEVSMHIVCALPANAARDLTGGNGTIRAHSAHAQLMIVGMILNLLAKDLLPDLGLSIPYSTFTPDGFTQTGIARRLKTEPFTIDTDTNASLPDAFASVGNVPVISESISPYSGTAAFDASAVQVPTTLSNVLVRIMNGLTPIGCETPSSAATMSAITQS